MSPTKIHRLYGLLFFAVSVGSNFLALVAAWRDRSWGAFGIATTGAPLLNGVLLILGLVAIPFLRNRQVGFSLVRHLRLTIGIPVAAVVIDAFAIISMGLHGC